MDGSLFQKNVRQSFGTNIAVNKKIRQTNLGDKHKDFLFSITVLQQFVTEWN
ncbi:MAG: hypothetical protein JST52_05970 [Bacteroidetes bacterium]|nr:hypothetical protein [Bacteroidota bacterium]